VSHWLSIEIFNGAYAARIWADTNGDALIESAVTSDAVDWEVRRTAWGVVFEVAFRTELECDRFKALDAVKSAIQTMPDPKNGVIIYKGRSTDSGFGTPRRPRPKLDSGSSALALPFEKAPVFEPLPALFSDQLADHRRLTKLR
jgi:hypothetical protein